MYSQALIDCSYQWKADPNFTAQLDMAINAPSCSEYPQ